MDTTPEYIEMCEKAGEIQAMEWTQDQIGHLVYIKRLDTLMQLDYDHKKCDELKEVWLPRQDQLQEMAFTNDTFKFDIVSNINCFNSWVKQNWIWGNSNDKQEYTTHEQLWLAFVMKEKFNKTWKDGEWK